MKNYTIRPINTGFATTSRGKYIFHHSTHKFYDVSGMEELPVVVFLVEGNGKKILVDTGMSSTEIADKYHHPGSVQPEGFAIYEQLEKIGINPDEIDMVILTHLHWDHCYHLNKFVNAEFVVQKKEYEFACNPIELYSNSYEGASTGLVPQFDGIKFTFVEGESEIMDGIRVYPTPGHSVGHQSIEINTKDGAYHCCGDLVFTYDNFKEIPQINYPITPPSRFQDILATWNSIIDTKNRAIDILHILPTHEISVVDRGIIG